MQLITSLKAVFFGLSFFILTDIEAQVQESWVRIYANTPTSSDQLKAMEVDNAGNVYVTGHTSAGIVTRKYDRDGNVKWTATHGGLDADAIAVDAAGNVYIGGKTGSHFLTIKYSPTGVHLWSASYDDDEDGTVHGIAVDASGNVYVTGTSITNNSFPNGLDFADYATVKYSSAGSELWVRRFNGSDPGTGRDFARAITIDAFGFIYVTGTSQLNGQLGIATIKYHPDGTTLWVSRFEGANDEDDSATDIILDAFGNVIVCGISQKNTPNDFDIYRNAVLVKYTFSGFELWNRSVFTSGNGHRVALDVDIDAGNNIVVAGYSEITQPGTQFICKYDPAGAQQWLRQLSGVSGRNGEVATDGINFYSAGISSAGLTTKKFNSGGIEQWSIAYATGSADPDRRLIGLDGDNNVYVSSWYRPVNFGNSDYLTIRYSQCELICPSSIVVNNEAGTCGAVVNYSPVTTTGYCGATISYSHVSGSTFPVGTTTVTATSDETGATCSFTITVNDIETPVITCPADKTLNADPGQCFASAASVNAGTATATDNCTPTIAGVRSDGQPLNANYPIGVTTINWTATDPGNNTIACTQTITVVDSEPPTITNVSVNPSVLWPPNHQMNNITVSYLTGDNCGSASAVLSVTSNEAQSGQGNGDQSPDWIITDANHLQLRAERNGKGDGRIYTITITATDSYGNTATATTMVVVPKNSSQNRGGQEEMITVNPLNSQLEVAALPNPSNTSFTIQLKASNLTEAINVQVTDLYGRLIETRKVASNELFIIGANYKPGTYIAHFIQGKEHKQIKLIKIMSNE
jgi:hypothetical protein